ncbi:MAG: hypothetical protein RIC56_03080 [Pseudomonadales bacterium]
MTDDELEERLRQHFADRLGGAMERAPSFQSTLAAAERRSPRGGYARRVGPLLVPAAAALLVWLWWPQSPRVDALSSPEVLLAELTSGTNWQAPSDRWLERPARPAYLGLPRIADGGAVLDPPALP